MDSGSATSNAGQAAVSVRIGNHFDFREIDQLQHQVGGGSVDGLRQFLAGSRRNQDWQDRYFVLDIVAPSIRPGSLDKICAAEPNAADLALIRGAHLFDTVAKSRGTKTADRTTKAQMAQAEYFVKAAVASVRQASQLDSSDPTPHVIAMRCFQVFTDLQKHLLQAYQQSVHVAPDFVPAHFAMVNARSQKWGGSHEQALQVARSAMTKAQSGSDAAGCLFLAHILVWQYARLFEKDRKRADAHLQDRQTTQELNDAFTRWIDASYQPRRSSIPYLHHAAYWYYQTCERPRLQQALEKTSGKNWDKAWAFAGDGPKTYGAALEFATTGKKNAGTEKKGFFGWLK